MVDTYEDLKAILDALKLPVAYDHFEKPQALPYIVYLTTGHNSFVADNLTFYENADTAVELYTEYKDPTLEQALKYALTGAGLFYIITTDEYLTTEQMHMVAFQVTI